MNFKDLKIAYPLHILDKQTLTYNTVKVTSVSLPHIDSKLTSTGMVVDVTVTTSEASPSATTTYCVVADADTAYPMNKVISTDRQVIQREVESLKAVSEQILSQIEHHKNQVEKCTGLLAILDPMQKEKQENETRFANLEASMNKMMNMLSKMTVKS